MKILIKAGPSIKVAAGQKEIVLVAPGTPVPFPFTAIASQAEAEAGADNEKGMTPLRVAQEIVAKVPATTSGAGVPTTTPTKLGQRYIDTTNKRVWEAVGTTDANDWRPTTGAYKDHGDTDSDLTIYASKANWHRIKVTGPFTLTIAGWRESGVPDSLTIELVDGSSSAVTWTTIPKTAGAAGFSLTASGTDILEISTRDGGTTQLGFQAAEDIK